MADPDFEFACLIASLVGGGFAWSEVREMTYSQMVLFNRAVAHGDVERAELNLAIVHNPYAAKDNDAKVLFDALAAQRRRLEGPALSLAPRAPVHQAAPSAPAPASGGIPLMQVLTAMGGAWVEENGKTRRMSPAEVMRMVNRGTGQHS